MKNPLRATTVYIVTRDYGIAVRAYLSKRSASSAVNRGRKHGLGRWMHAVPLTGIKHLIKLRRIAFEKSYKQRVGR